jgi:adhesin/invasin
MIFMFMRILQSGWLLLFALLAGCSGGGAFDGGTTAPPPTDTSSRTLSLPAGAQVQVKLLNNNQHADGSSAVQLFVSVRSAAGIPLSNISVQLSLRGDGLVQVAETSGATDAGGIFTTNITSHFPGTVLITPIIGGNADSGPVVATFVPVPGPSGSTGDDKDIASIHISVADPFAVADGNSTVSLIAIVRDSSRLPITGVPVFFRSSSNTALFANFTGVTGLDGAFRTTLTNTVPEIVNIVASAGTRESTPQVVTFAGAAAEGRQLSMEFSVDNDQQPADNQAEIKLTVVARDQNNIPVAGQRVNLSATGGALTQSSGTTQANGTFNTTIKSASPGQFTVTAWFDGVQSQAATQTITFTTASTPITQGDYAITWNVTSDYQMGSDNSVVYQQANGSSQVVLEVFAKTLTGAPVADAAISLFVEKVSINPGDSLVSSALLANPTGKTDASGYFRTTITNVLPETFQVRIVSVRESESYDQRKEALSKTIQFLSTSPGDVDSGDPAPLGSTVYISASKNTAEADGQDTITINVMVSKSGVRLNNIPVRLHMALDGRTGDAAYLYKAIFGDNGAAGVTQNGQFTTTLTSTAGETLILSATVKDINGQDITSNQVTLNFNKASSLVLLTSSPQILSGANEQVTITALLKDNNNNPVNGQRVNFRVSSGNIEPQNNGVTDAQGRATAILRSTGEPDNRTIIVTASAEGVAREQSLEITVSGTALAITGPTHTTNRDTPTFTVSMRDSTGTGVAGKPVTIKSTQGNTLKFGTTEYSSGTATINTNQSGRIDIMVVKPTNTDANGEDTLEVSYSGATSASFIYNISNDIFCVVREPRALIRDNPPAGMDFCTLGENPDMRTAEGTLEAALTDPVLLNTPVFFSVYWERPGEDGLKQAKITTTRGGMTPNAYGSFTSCDFARDASLIVDHSEHSGSSSSPLNIFGGNIASFMICANNAGPATIDIEESLRSDVMTEIKGPATRFSFDFIADRPASLRLQAFPDSIGINAAGSDAEQSEIIAVVRDGQNNLVKGQRVEFSLEDVTGGRLSPSFAETDSFGRASVVYIAGASPSAGAGVRISARLAENYALQDQIYVTVARRSAFVTLAFANQIYIVNETTYSYPGTVLVNDINGAPLPDTRVNLRVVPLSYRTGWLVEHSQSNSWAPNPNTFCYSEDRYAEIVLGNPASNTNNNAILDRMEDINGNCVLDANEDTNFDGRLDSEDVNCNGKLDPGNPVSLTPFVTTDENGFADFLLYFPKDYANWTDIRVVATTLVAGTEGRDFANLTLPGAKGDFSLTAENAPPGFTSPFGSIFVRGNEPLSGDAISARTNGMCMGLSQ